MRASLDGAVLAWGIRAGFRDYLAVLDDLVEDREGVSFDAEREAWIFAPAGQGSKLRIRAHAGAMDIAIVDLRVVQVDQTWLLVVTGGVPIARLLDGPGAQGDSRVVFSDVALTVEGSQLFGGVYGPWARMDAVTVEGG